MNFPETAFAFSLSVFDSSDYSSSDPVSPFGLSVTPSLCQSAFISELASRVAYKVATCHFHSFWYSKHKSASPTLEYYSQVWDGTSSTSVSHLDRVQQKAIWLIDDPSLTFNLSSSGHHRAVVLLPYIYLPYLGLCSSRITSRDPILAAFSRTSRTHIASHFHQICHRISYSDASNFWHYNISFDYAAYSYCSGVHLYA